MINKLKTLPAFNVPAADGPADHSRIADDTGFVFDLPDLCLTLRAEIR